MKSINIFTLFFLTAFFLSLVVSQDDTSESTEVDTRPYFDLDCLTCQKNHADYFFCNINNTRTACCHPDSTDYFCTTSSKSGNSTHPPFSVTCSNSYGGTNDMIYETCDFPTEKC